jgi:hypothetical protein
MLMPRGLILDGLLPRSPIGANIITALVDGMRQMYGKNEMKIVTVGPTVTLGLI